MKQTAVEWLIEQIQLAEEIYGGEFDLIVNQAKEMEKEQIREAFRMGDVEGCVDFDYNDLDEQYYNETYKNTELCQAN